MENLNEIKEALKDMFRATIKNAKDGDDENGRWVTIKGTHVFIPDGKQVEDVMREKGWLSDGKEQKSKWKSYKEVREQAEKQLEYVKSKLKEKNSPERHEALVSGKKELEDRIKYYKEHEAEDEDDIDSELVLLQKADPEAIKREKETNDRWQKAIKETAEREGWNKPDTEKKDKVEGKKGYSLSKEYKNHVQFEGDKESGGYPRKIHKDLESAKKSFETKKEGQSKAEETNLKRSGKRGIPLRDNPVIVKNPLGDGFIVATSGLAEKHGLTEVYPVDREGKKIKNGLSEIIENCKPETKQDLKVLKGLKNILENENK